MKFFYKGKDVGLISQKKFLNIQEKKPKALIAKYKFDRSISNSLIPEFSSGFINYEIVDEYLDTENMAIRSIYSDKPPTSISFADEAGLLEVYYVDTSGLTSTYNLFYNCKNLAYVDLRNSDFSNVETIERMFTSCVNLLTIDGLNDLDISKVNNMGGIFSDCRKLSEINVSNWNVSKVTNFGAAFRRCYEITTLDVSNWDTSSAAIMSGMFTNCTKLSSIDLSNWDMNNVTTVNQMFYGCSNLTSLNLYNHLNDGVDTLYLFGNCNSLSEVEICNSDYNTINMIIAVLPNKTQDNLGILDIMGIDNISLVNIEDAQSRYWSIKDMKLIAQYKFDKSIYEDLVPYFNNSFINYKITDEIIEDNIVNRCIHHIETPTMIVFGDADEEFISTNRSSALLEVSFLDISLLTSFEYMFMNCINLTAIECANWDTSNIINMAWMFGSYGGTMKITDLNISNWNVNNVVDMNNMFQLCINLTSLDLSNWNTSNVTNMAFMFYGCNYLTSLDLSNWDTLNVTNMGGMFGYCESLTTILGIENFNTSNVVYFSYDYYGMFESCKSLTELNLSNWNTDKVTSMGYMFSECESLTSLDLNNFNTSNVTSISWMFYNCQSLTSLNVSNWDTSNVTNMEWMFGANAKLTSLDLANWNTDKVTTMKCMFYQCYKLSTINGELSNFNNNNNVLTDISYMFYSCSSLASLDLSNWKTGLITSTRSLFCNCNKLTSVGDIKNWDVSNVIDMGWMFDDCYILQTLDLSGWNVEKVEGTYQMFSGCKTMTELNLSEWKLSALREGEYVQNMFYGNTTSSVYMLNSDYNSINKIIEALPTRTQDSLGTLDIEGVDDIDQVNVTTAQSKFWNIVGVSIEPDKMLVARYTANTSDVLPVFNEGYQYTVNETESNGIYTIELESSEDFTSCNFREKTNLLTVEYLKVTNKVTDMSWMFSGCYSLTSIDVSNFDTSNVADMTAMFSGCYSLTSLDVSNWNTSNVIDMSYMFAQCKSLTTLDVSNWNTGNVTTMVNMFDLCSSLVSLDVSNWNVSKVQNMGAMFGTCSSLKELNVSNWETDSLTKADWMFNKCLNLQELDLSSWNVSNVADISYALSDCESLKQLNLSNWNLNNANVTGIFTAYSYDGCPNLTFVIMNDSDYASVNKIIAQLPTRTQDSLDALNIVGIDDINQVDMTIINSRYWTIVSHTILNNAILGQTKLN